MKILLIHCFYQQRGGEDVIVEQESRLLSNENEVRLMAFHNKKGVAGGIGFLLAVWNVFAAAKIKRAIREFKPDVFHIHNWHFATGPLVIRTAKRAGLPVIFSVHNYRLLCPSVYLLHREKLFVNSLKESFPWTAIKKKVYHNSSLQTFWLAFIVWFHKKIGTWKKIDRYIVNTGFAKELFLNSSFNLKQTQLAIKPNFVQRLSTDCIDRGDHFLFIGRLSEEKGIRLLLKTFSKLSFQLKIAGTGPLLSEVSLACNEYSNITYLGNLDKKDIIASMQKCSALILPSLWYEGMPMVMIEAFSCGTLIIASDLGAMQSMIQHKKTGLLFEVNNGDDLTDNILYWQTLPVVEKNQYLKNILFEYNKLYTPENNLKMLNAIYKDCTAL